MKYTQGKSSNPQKTHTKKISDQKLPSRKNFGTRKNHKKKFQTHDIPMKIIWEL